MKWSTAWLAIVTAVLGSGMLQTGAQDPPTTTTGGELNSQSPHTSAPATTDSTVSTDSLTTTNSPATTDFLTTTWTPPLTSPKPTVTTQEREEDLPYLIFAKRVSIHRVDLDGTNLETLITNSSLTTNAIALDFDARQGTLFWTDVRQRTVAMSQLDGSNATLLVDTDLTFPDGIAWDWINEKLYWSDAEHREIEVMDPANGDRMQLVQTGLDTIPRDVVVDPNTRWLYWTDWGEVAKIERISMAGEITSRQTLHNTALTWPNALAIDYTTQTLYWADAQLNKIETSKVDGSNRTLLTTTMVLHPFAITFYDGFLYWSDWQTDQIFTTHVTSPNDVSVLVGTFDTEPMGLVVMTESRQPINSSNPCPGNCSHLCLLSSVNELEYACGCPLGMTLDMGGVNCTEVEVPTTLPEEEGSCQRAGYTSCCTDGDCLGSPPVCFCDQYCHQTDSCCKDISVSCREVTTEPPPPPTLTSPFILFANRQSINQMSLNGSNLSPLIGTTVNSIALDYSFREQYVYWTDVSTRTISRARMDGTETTVLLSSNIGIPDGLACDWVTNKLYWTDASTKSISVYDLDHAYRLRLISLNSSSTPRAIIVDPGTRLLFWSDWGTPAKIERASMDGTYQQTLFDTELIWPNALSIDRKNQVLYWADASLDKIESSKIDGSNRRVLLRDGILHPFSIVAFNDTLYWSDWQADTIFTSRLIGTRLTNSTSLLRRLSAEPMTVQVISEEVQIALKNPCEIDNGNCSHFCLLSTSERGIACACPNGFIFEEGSTQSCVQIPTEPIPTEPSVPGSCRAAGHNSCCVDDLCEGEPPICFCDIYCFEFEDCCDDFREICPGPEANTTTAVPPPSTTMPSPMMPSPSPTMTTTVVRPTDNNIVPSSRVRDLFTSSASRGRSRGMRPTTAQTQPVETAIPRTIVGSTQQGNLVGVGVVVGSLLASVFTIIFIALMVVLVITMLIIRQRNAFSRYEVFGETNNKEMTLISRRFKSPPTHEAKA